MRVVAIGPKELLMLEQVVYFCVEKFLLLDPAHQIRLVFHGAEKNNYGGVIDFLTISGKGVVEVPFIPEGMSYHDVVKVISMKVGAIMLLKGWVLNDVECPPKLLGGEHSFRGHFTVFFNKEA